MFDVLGGFGFAQVIILIAILAGGGWFLRNGNGMRISGPTLVLRSFKIDDAQGSPEFLNIVGRASGIMAWLLTIIGFSPETSFSATDKELSFKSSSLFGENHQVIPLAGISSTHCGYSKPVLLLVIGAISVLGGLSSVMSPLPSWGGFFGGLFIGGVLILIYYLSKKMFIAVETRGGMLLHISFKRSVIENVSVEMDQALRAIHLINQKALAAQAKPL